MRRLQDEGGMTLIEMLIGMTVLGIVIGPITASLMFGLMTSNGTRDRIADSLSAQLTSVYFLKDVQSSDSVLVPSASSPSPACGGTGTVLLRMVWDDPSPAAGDPVGYIASYVDRANGSTHTLHRVLCDDLGAQLHDTEIIASFDSLTFTCTPSCVPDVVETPTSVAVDVSARNPETTSSGYVAYPFRYEAARRVT
jgi:prepilin-type N-terminal cleavage/methylation domain-containing protein